MTNRRRNKIITSIKLTVMFGLLLVIVFLVYPIESSSRRRSMFMASAAVAVVTFVWAIWSIGRPDPELDAIEEDLNRTRAALGQPPIDEKPVPILPIANSKNELAAGILFVIILIGVIVAKYGFDLF